MPKQAQLIPVIELQLYLSMKNALITGANKGIGYETARQLLKLGYYVFLGARNSANGEEAVKSLHAEGLMNVETLLLDVNNAASILSAKDVLSDKINSLDLLINNAGIPGSMPPSPIDSEMGEFRSVFETNVFGLVEVTKAFADLLKRADAPRIVNVSSSLGSLTLQSDPSWSYYGVMPVSYFMSKAAVNAYTVALAYDLRNTSFKVNAVDPGYTSTDFTENQGSGTVEVAAARIIKAATLGSEGPTGQFFSEEYNSETGVSPW